MCWDGHSVARSPEKGGPALLDVASARLVRVALCPCYRQAGNRDHLTSPGISVVLDLEEPPGADRQTGIGERDPWPPPLDKSSESALGSTADPWTTPQTGDRPVPSDGRQAHGSAPKTTLADVACFPQKPRAAVGLDGFLRRTDCYFQCLIRLYRLGPRSETPAPFQRHRPSQFGMDRTTDSGGVPLGPWATLPPPRTRLDL